MSNKQALPYDYKRSIRIDDNILPEKWQEMDEESLKKVVRHTKQMNTQLKRKVNYLTNKFVGFLLNTTNVVSINRLSP